jgi:hypothetical protein
MKAAKKHWVPTRLTAREVAELTRLQNLLSEATGVQWSRSDVIRAGLVALKEKNEGKRK